MDDRDLTAKMLSRGRRRRRTARDKHSPLTATLAPSVKHTALTPPPLALELTATAETLPIFPLLPRLFTDPRMFDSYAKFGDDGFRLVKHAENKIMAGSHRSAPGYMFKKYNNDKPGKKQLLNYMLRVEGSRLLRAFIAEHNFAHVVSPRKWLYELPAAFPARHLVVAEQLDLADSDDTHRNYERISEEQMRELATILYYFRGLNSTAANLPFTEDGRVAFIDTERWANGKDYLRKVGDRLPSDRRKLAEDVYAELRGQGARPFRSVVKRSRRRDKEGDFASEEDTSSA